MFEEFIKFRKEYDVDNLLNWNGENEAEYSKYYPRGYVGCDKIGRPIFVDRCGLLKVSEILKLGPE
jgi:hypothetical protein